MEHLPKFQCDICGQIIYCRKNLDKHFDRHRNLSCKICNKKYLDRNNLKNHLRSHFDGNYFVICDVCGQSVSPWKLKRHKEQHEPKKKKENAKSQKFNCRYCGLIFDKANNRSSHEKRIHRTKINLGFDNFKCQECKEIFKTQIQLREHSFTHYSGKIYFCDFKGCNKYFKKGKLVTVHKRCHYEPQYKCIECGKMFVQKTGLTKHSKDRCPAKKSVNNVIPLTQNEINTIAKNAKEQYIALRGTLFNKSKSYVQPPINHNNIRHEFIEIETRENNNDGEDWSYEFLDEALLEFENSSKIVENLISYENNAIIEPKMNLTPKKSKNYSQVHCKEENEKFDSFLMCNMKNCDEKFKSQLLLMNHKSEIHNEKRKRHKPFTCDRCGKDFYSRSSIQTHLVVTHKTVADHNCVYCVKSFKSQGNLQRHIKSVHGNENTRMWGCEKCGKMAKERYQLDIHLHNHDEPSECKICQRMVSNMKVHLRNHNAKSNNVQIKCDLCGKLMGKYQLMRHIKTVHEKQFQRDRPSLNMKIYACKECGDLFSRKQELRQHEYIHFSGKLFSCDFEGCKKIFKKLKLLNVHRFVHQPQNVSCEICKNVYARKSALWKHQKKNHPELILNQKVNTN